MESEKQFMPRFVAQGKMKLFLSIIIVVAILVGSGYFYRQFASYLDKVVSKPVLLDYPLKNIPHQIGDWVGKDVEIPPDIIKIAGNDDFINRRYSNSAIGISVNVYVAFSARPGLMRGHQPKFCYVGSGWRFDLVEPKAITTQKGRKVSYLLHKFSKDGREISVLNFYVLNGKVVNSEAGFSGISFRTPNIGGQLARYVAQIQVSSRYPSGAESALESVADDILDLLPDENGRVFPPKGYLSADDTD